VHHGVNQQYLDKNYCGILIVWDRLFGTFIEEDEAPVYGVRGGLGTFDPLWANVSYYATMADMSWRAQGWRDKLWAWFAPPGWRPANLRPAGPEAPFDVKAVRCYDPPAAAAASILALMALAGMVGATAAFLAFGPELPLANGFVVFLALTATVWAMGALMDRRISIAEALFVFSAALCCVADALGWRSVEMAAKPAAMALLILSVAMREGPSDVKRLVLCAFAASLVGDTALLWPSLFLPGLAAFAVAHGFYIAAFSRGVGFWRSRAATIVILAFGVLLLAYVWPGVSGEMKAPVAFYVALLALMASQAAGRATVLHDRAALAVAAGGLLFMVSDATIALTKFAAVGWAGQWTLPTYYVAQGLIAFFILPRMWPASDAPGAGK
jgi:alkylglycerol monooxygenase